MRGRIIQRIYDAPDPLSGDTIAEALGSGLHVDSNDDIRLLCGTIADAVLDALMEPSVDMEVVGDAAHDAHLPNALEIFRAMIQAAKEGK